MWFTNLCHARRALPLFLAAAAFAATPTLEIKVDQAGYLPDAPKVAIVVSKAASGEFTVRKSANNAVAFRGKLAVAADDADSGDRVRAADFSTLTKAGKYYLDVPGAGRSWAFEIRKDVYSPVYYLAMRSYYGQRCGTAVDLGDGYKHEACHLEGAYHASSGKSGPHVSKGGWHDAGDYGRYVVNSGITTGTLLWAWEMFKPGLKLKIPETGNGTPDILSEIRWNLDWMLTMQDEDGGVWHKQTSEKFCPFVMPEKDTLVSYVIGTGQEPYKSSCATGDLAAVAAIGARVFKLGGGKNIDALNAIRQDSLAAADQIVERSSANGYRISLTSRDYVWGSNGVVANYGMQLLVANAFRKDPRFVDTALENLHYLLGRNTFSLSWVTHVGEHPFQHPHHRPSGADTNAEPWPGLMSGGPNRNKNQDPAMRKLPDGLPPAKSYVDDQEAYSANEVAINWNAPLVFLLAGVLR
jgi:Glycosyl hydrolase family 9/Cellulase N-terminal ig-like domain